MKKFLLHSISFLFLCAFTVLPVLAATSTPSGIGSSFDFENNQNLNTTVNEAGYYQSGSGEERFDTIIGSVITLGFSIIGIVFIILIIVAGINYMVSDGNQEKVSEAKSSIKSAIIGLVITLGAYAISWFIINLLIAPTLKTAG